MFIFSSVFWIVLRTVGDVLKGCAGWSCSPTNEVEAGAELSSQGAELGSQVCWDSDVPVHPQSSEAARA